MQNSTLSSQIQQITQLLKAIQNHQQTSQNSNLNSNLQSNNIEPISQQLQPLVKIIFNSLKLNQKLHNAILLKQTEIQQQTKTFMTHSQQTQHKLQQTLKRTKQLYQQTIHQNQKSKFLLEQFISPIRQQLKSKVDQTTFSLQMKMLLDEYDSMGHKITYDMTEQQKLKQQTRKTIQSQTLTFLKDKVLPILSDLQNKFESYQLKNIQYQNKIDDLTSKTISIGSELKLQQQSVQENQKIVLNTINQQIKQKIDEKTVNKKITQLFKTLIQQNNKNISNQILKSHEFSKNLQYHFNQQIQNVKIWFSETFKNAQNSQNSLLYQIEKHQKQLETQQGHIQKYEKQLQNIHQQFKKYDNNIQFVNKFHEKFENLELKIQNGQFKGKSELKPQEVETLMYKLNEFQIQSKKLKKFEKQAEEKSLIFRGQLQGIRDILSKKANFSDILMHMQNKVDKKQFKELKIEFQESKQKKLNCLSNSQKMIESQRSLSSKKKHLRNQSFFSPSGVEKPSSSTEQQIQEVRRFKLGFTSEFFIPSDGVKKYSRTQHLRQSIRDNSNIFKQLTHQD